MDARVKPALEDEGLYARNSQQIPYDPAVSLAPSDLEHAH
jgi:hypothetical protein